MILVETLPLARRFLEAVGGVGQLAAGTARSSLRRPFGLAEVGRQIEGIGYRSLPVVVLTAVFSSMVITVQFAVQLERFGAKEYVGNVVALSLVRELGPVMTALMVGGRVASGIAAELGSMKVSEQIDAMRSMGADPIRELVLPRVVAAALVMPLLTVTADILGLAGAMGIARLSEGIPTSYFAHACLRALTLPDLCGGLIKTVAFGVCIALIACRAGLEAGGGTRGVGRATTHAVVSASITILVLDFLLTKTLMELGL